MDFKCDERISEKTGADSRALTVIETSKKRQLSALEVLCRIVTAVMTGQPYPDVFNLTSA